MGQLYWITEYVKVMLAYCFVIYLWPMVVFEAHLKGRSRTYRFGFCVTVSVLIVNTGVLALGLIHALRPWVTSSLYLGVFLWQLLIHHNPVGEIWRDVKMVNHETMTLRRFWARRWERLRSDLRRWASPLWENTAGHRLEYLLLGAALVFGTIYFSYGGFDGHSYGFGDQYVHHQWIHGLTEGKAFYNGIYPEAMHCVIYLTCTLFHIRLYSGVLFFAGIHVHVLLISAYLFMKEVFHWRYTPLVVLAMYLTFDQLCVDEVFAMSRLSWTLPMEFALHTGFLCAAYLMRFLKRILRGHRVKLCPRNPKQWGVLHDGDLFLFSMAIASSLAVHFYATIAAFFFCLMVALVYFRQALRSFLPLAAAVIIGFTVAMVPMGAAFAMGYPLQGSLYWAMRVVQNGEAHSQASNAQPVDAAEPADSDDLWDTGASTNNGESQPGPSMESSGVIQSEPAPSSGTRLGVQSKLITLYEAGYRTLYPGVRSTAILIATAFALITSLLMHWILLLREILRRRHATARGEEPPEPGNRDWFDGILITALLSIVFMIMYSASALGIPELVAGSRLCSTEQMLLLMLYCVPLDYLLSLLAHLLGEQLPMALSWAAFIGVYLFTQAAGIFHSYPYFELTRYNAAVEITNHIMDTLPRQTFTIISTTDELYQVIESGYHEELLTFLQREADPTYTIPTPYLLLYVEKHPLQYAQYHFAQGPRWLARQEYVSFYPTVGSQCPDILSGEISTAEAGEDILYGAKLSDTAATLAGRTIMESKAYRWYQEFSRLYPRSCRIIYEDEDFMCCCIVQNPGSLYTLGIMDAP